MTTTEAPTTRPPWVEARTDRPGSLVMLTYGSATAALVIGTVSVDRPDGTGTEARSSAAWAGTHADDVAHSALVQGF